MKVFAKYLYVRYENFSDYFSWAKLAVFRYDRYKVVILFIIKEKTHPSNALSNFDSSVSKDKKKRKLDSSDKKLDFLICASLFIHISYINHLLSQTKK